MTPSKSKFENRESKILLGAHMSIGGGVHRAIERSCSIECTALQMFVKNNMQWFARTLDRSEIKAFVRHAQRKQIEALELPDQFGGDQSAISRELAPRPGRGIDPR
jgi:hypothetical protein